MEPDGKSEGFFYGVMSISAGACSRFMLTARNYEGRLCARESHADLQNLIAEQDRIIVENQRPEESPLDLAEEHYSAAVMGRSLEELIESFPSSREFSHFNWRYSESPSDLCCLQGSCDFVF